MRQSISTGIPAQRVQAIETRYAGCRFRSRLEARWAVFFDTLGIEWQYEPEGVLCSARLTHSMWAGIEGDQARPYLPDFWLPAHAVWIEVKGALDGDSLTKVLDCAADLAPNYSYGKGPGNTVILGPIPRTDELFSVHAPCILHMHKGDLDASPWLLEGPDVYLARGPQTVNIARDVGGTLEAVIGEGESGLGVQGVADLLLRGFVVSRYHPIAPRLLAAYAAARSARFEHGESGR